MMEAGQNRIDFSCFENVLSVCVYGEETAETVVPDVLPDICRIIDADGIVTLRSKTADQGAVSVSGTINATVLYVPEDGAGVCRLSMDIPYSMSYACGDINESSIPVASVRLCSIDARMLNPRKVLVRADMEAQICVYNPGARSVGGMADAGTDTSTNVLNKEISFTTVTSAGEKTFIITDEYQLPANLPKLDVMLKEKLELTVDEVKPVGNKVLFKGIARFELMYAGPEGEIASTTWASSFSQILDSESDGEPELRVMLMPTGVYFEPLDTADGRVIKGEIHAVAQAVSLQRTEASFVMDAYSNKFKIEMERESVELTLNKPQISLRETMHELIEIPGSASEVIGVYAKTGAVSVGESELSCPVSVSIIYCDENGEMMSLYRKVSLNISHEIAAELTVESIASRCIEPYAAPAAGGIDLRLPVDITISVQKNVSFEAVIRIAEDTEEPKDCTALPSVIALQGTKEDLWSLAKRHGSTPELILEANNITDISEAEGVILVPCCR